METIGKSEIEKLTDSQILDFEKQLQLDSDKILEHFNLMRLLSRYGTPHIKGGKEMGVMWAKDIDIKVIAKDLSIDRWIQLCSELLKIKGVRKIFPINYRDYDREVNWLSEGNKGFGYLVSINNLNVPDVSDSRMWNIEMSLVEDDGVFGQSEEGRRATKDWKEKLTETSRVTIIRLKMFIAEASKKLKEMGFNKIDSLLVYDAVFNNNVSSIDDFIKYYETKEQNQQKVYTFLKLMK